MFPDNPLTAELMSLPIRPSSARVYQSHWIVFLDFLRREGVVSLSQCTLWHAVKFLTLLFKQRDILLQQWHTTALHCPLPCALYLTSPCSSQPCLLCFGLCPTAVPLALLPPPPESYNMFWILWRGCLHVSLMMILWLVLPFWCSCTLAGAFPDCRLV